MCLHQAAAEKVCFFIMLYNTETGIQVIEPAVPCAKFQVFNAAGGGDQFYIFYCGGPGFSVQL